MQIDQYTLLKVCRCYDEYICSAIEFSFLERWNSLGSPMTLLIIFTYMLLLCELISPFLSQIKNAFIVRRSEVKILLALIKYTVLKLKNTTLISIMGTQT